jgi:hypothetical protein
MIRAPPAGPSQGGTARRAGCRVVPRRRRSRRTRTSLRRPRGRPGGRHSCAECRRPAPHGARQGAARGLRPEYCSSRCDAAATVRPPSLSTMPGIHPSPAWSPNSSPRSARTCIPTQMPRKGLPSSSTTRRRSSIGSVAAIFRIAAPMAPTPGSTMCVAARMAVASFDTCTARHSLTDRLKTDRTLPGPCQGADRRTAHTPVPCTTLARSASSGLRSRRARKVASRAPTETAAARHGGRPGHKHDLERRHPKSFKKDSRCGSGSGFAAMRGRRMSDRSSDALQRRPNSQTAHRSVAGTCSAEAHDVGSRWSKTRLAWIRIPSFLAITGP